MHPQQVSLRGIDKIAKSCLTVRVLSEVSSYSDVVDLHVATSETVSRAAFVSLARQTLRAQFTLLISFLAFLPNLVLTLGSAPTLGWSQTLWIGVVALVSALSGYVLSGALLRPLHRLELEVGQGTFAQGHTDDPREIRALRQAFSSLITRLSTEQSRRNAFMATLVHDLKTPLIATSHLTRALTEWPMPDAERREVGSQMQAETARLLTLVGQMADAHRFEREEVRLERRPTALGEVLGSVARRLEPQARARGLRLSVSGTGTAPVDPAALERAVGNLADNALRYATGEVRLRVTPGGVQVQDDGPGLSAELADLAQPFNAQPTTIAGQQYTAGSAGLGLFIARRISEAHGGELTYHRTPAALPTGSPPPGFNPPLLSASPPARTWTTFTITLPEVTA